MVPKAIRKNLMVDYLNDKYTDDHFEFIEYSGGKPWSNESLTILCSSKKYPDKTVEIRYLARDDKYYDNYLGLKYAEQLDKYVDKLERELFPDYKTKHSRYSENTTNSMLLDLSATTSFDEYLENCRESVKIYCECSPNELEKNKDAIKNKMEEVLPNKEMGFGVVDLNFTSNVDRDMNVIVRDVYSYLHIVFDDVQKNKLESIDWR